MANNKRGMTLSEFFWFAAIGNVVLFVIDAVGAFGGSQGEFGALAAVASLPFILVLGVTMWVVKASRTRRAYWIGLVVVALPTLCWAFLFAGQVFQFVMAPSDQERMIRARELDEGRGIFPKPADAALADAIEAGDAAKVAALAPAADLRAVGANDITFMDVAFKWGHARPDVIGALLRAGAWPDGAEDELFAAHWSTDKNYRHGRLLRAAVDAGVDMNRANEVGDPRFFETLCWAGPEIITYMLDHGANLEAQSRFPYGDTAIGYVVIHCSEGPIDLLLSLGARTDHVNSHGESLHDVVSQELKRRADYFSGTAVPPQLTALELRLRQ